MQMRKIKLVNSSTRKWPILSLLTLLSPDNRRVQLVTISNHYYWHFSGPGMGLNFSKCLSNPISFPTLFTDPSLQVPVQPVVFSSSRQENQDNQRGQP